MILFVQLLHIFLSFFLILIILLQPGKDSGAVFGGQSGNSAYAARSNANPLGRATTIVAVIFMTTSITLAFYSTPDAQEGSDMEETLKSLEKRIAKKDLKFEAPKLPNIQPSMLMTPKPILIAPSIDETNTPSLEEPVKIPG